MDTVGIRGAGAALPHVVAASLREAGALGEADADLDLVERTDGAIEVWPSLRAVAGDPRRQGAVLARCLTALKGSGLSVELVCRDRRTFIRVAVP